MLKHEHILSLIIPLKMKLSHKYPFDDIKINLYKCDVSFLNSDYVWKCLLITLTLNKHLIFFSSFMLGWGWVCLGYDDTSSVKLRHQFLPNNLYEIYTSLGLFLKKKSIFYEWWRLLKDWITYEHFNLKFFYMLLRAL